MRTARWIAVALLFGLGLYMCALPGDLPADVDTTDGLAGTYTANGFHPNGSEFSGTAVFTATDDPSVFDYQLIITGSIQKGTAVLSGDTIAITWETVSSASDDVISGVGDFSLGRDGGVRGTWWVGTETGPGDPDARGTIELFPDQ